MYGSVTQPKYFPHMHGHALPLYLAVSSGLYHHARNRYRGCCHGFDAGSQAYLFFNKDVIFICGNDFTMIY